MHERGTGVSPVEPHGRDGHATIFPTAHPLPSGEEGGGWGPSWGYAYGGDFGDHPNDGLWGVCGLTPPDGAPRPVLAECRAVFQPVAVARRGDRLAITNRRDFSPLDDLAAAWCLTDDGREIAAGTFDLPPIGPGETAELPLPPLPATVGEGVLTVRFALARATAWAEAGFEVAWAQEIVAPAPPHAVHPAPHAVEHAGDCLTLRAGDLRLRWLARQGRWFSLRAGGRELFWDNPALCLWRAPLDTDIAFRDAWLREDLHQLRAAIGEAVLDGDGVCTTVLWRNLHGDDVVRHTLWVQPVEEGLLLTNRVEPLRPLPALPRVGVRFRLAADLTEAAWYGRGPHECLPDRCRGAWIGAHACPVDALAVPYVHPQENGMRCDVRRLALTAADGFGVTITGAEPFTFTARRTTLEDLAHATHDEEIIRRPFVELCLDHRHAGTGNTTLRAERLAQYQVPAADYTWQWLLAVARKRR